MTLAHWWLCLRVNNKAKWFILPST